MEFAHACRVMAALVLLPSLLAHGDVNEAESVALPDGCFSMGDDKAYPEEAPVHQQCVNGFKLSRTEITNGQFDEFVRATGYVTRAERGWSAEEAEGPGIDLPPGSAVFVPPAHVDMRAMNWWQFVEGASWRNPVGAVDAPAPDPRAPVVQVTREDAEAYAGWVNGRLPTEAEWEYAARAGLETWDDAEREHREAVANTWQGLFPIVDSGDDGHKGIAPVASYPANSLGLYDMIGNVWEWTSTPYAASHSDADKQRAGSSGFDPRQSGIPSGTIKGGSYLCATSYCYRFRSAARQAQDLALGTSHIGFRVAWDMDGANDAPDD